MTLGNLVWWRVGEVRNLNHDHLADLLKDSGVKLPARPIPIDVYRRVTTTALKRYAVGDDYTLECTVAPVETTSDKMITHHLVGTIKHADSNVTESVRKIGDMAFYKPPRGQHAKSRMRVLATGVAAFPQEVEAFVEHLRKEYDTGVKGALDGQAIRRIIRTHLASEGVLYLDGPYFFQRETQITGLEPLFQALGGDSFIHDVPFPDTQGNRAFLERGLGRAVNAGLEVDESLWKILEGEEAR